VGVNNLASPSVSLPAGPGPAGGDVRGANPSCAQVDEESSRIGAWALGRWRLEELLGSGGMSTVYGAVHRTNGKRVAVKVLHPHLGSMPEAVDRFLGEGSVANKIEHPGVVSVFDDGTMDDGTLCLVMDKLVGGSLDQWLERRGALPVLETVLILDRLLDVLAAAHRAGVVHRDMKPHNVFVTAYGSVKLLDFGIARCVESSGTLTGAIMGTPAYMPPEQAEGRWKDVDVRSDIFAVGAVAIALLVGEAPRSGDTANLTLLAAMSQPLAGVRARALDVPPAVADVIDRAIAWRREDRYPTAEAMAEALRAAWFSSCRVRLDGHERHLAPVGRLLASPARESGVCRMADPSSTEAMAVGHRTLFDAVAPIMREGKPAGAMTTLRRSLRDLPRSPQWLILALAAAMVVALVTGVAIAQIVAPERAPAPSAVRRPKGITTLGEASPSADRPARQIAP
jgi:eukaryotic-like serine/threonine-protein kinase